MINPQQHILHRGLTSIQGPLVFVRNAEGVGLYDRVEVLVKDGGESRIGRIGRTTTQCGGRIHELPRPITGRLSADGYLRRLGSLTPAC